MERGMGSAAGFKFLLFGAIADRPLPTIMLGVIQRPAKRSGASMAPARSIYAEPPSCLSDKRHIRVYAQNEMRGRIAPSNGAKGGVSGRVAKQARARK